MRKEKKKGKKREQNGFGEDEACGVLLFHLLTFFCFFVFVCVCVFALYHQEKKLLIKLGATRSGRETRNISRNNAALNYCFFFRFLIASLPKSRGDEERKKECIQLYTDQRRRQIHTYAMTLNQKKKKRKRNEGKKRKNYDIEVVNFNKYPFSVAQKNSRLSIHTAAASHQKKRH